MIKKKRLVNTFTKLCKIDSPSGKEEKIIEYLRKKFEAFDAKVYEDADRNILFKIKGKGEPIFLNSHLDTVVSTKGLKIINSGNILKTDGKTILGGDDRAGIAIILETLDHFKEENIEHRPLEILFTAGEEQGLVGVRKFDFKKIKAKIGFIFDEEGKISDIINKSVGYVGFEGKIIGKFAHSSEPQNGIHAIKAVSELIHTIPFGKCSENTMVNVGILQGGGVVNSIAEESYIKGEIRSLSKPELKKYTNEIKEHIKRVNKKYGTKDTIKFKEEFSPFSIEKNSKFLADVIKSMKEVGLKPKVDKTMGGSDANIINRNGIQALQLAAGYYKCHSKQEYVKVNELVDGVKFLDYFLCK